MLKNFKKVRVEEEGKQKDAPNMGAAEKRIKIDLQNYNENQIENAQLSFPKEDCIFEIRITITPNKERSFYKNSRINFLFKVNEEYPHKAPEVTCINKILHPNIDQNGKVCLSVLREGWKPIYDIYVVTMGLLHLLENISSADLEKPLDEDAAKLMNKDLQQFKKVVQHTLKGNSYLNRKFDNVYYEAPNKK